MARIFGLDFLRALAIWGVLLSHGKHFLVGDHRANNVFSVGGTLGVEAFFVLSGFLIGGILLREIGRPRPSHHAALGFLLRRWFRTLPMYYAALLLYITLALFFEGQAPGLSWTHLVFLQNAAGAPAFMGVSWSLTIEEWFYFLAATTLVALGGFRGRGKRLVFIAIVLIALSTAGRYSLAVDGAGWETTRKLLWFHFDAIAVGVILAYVRHRRPEWLARGHRAMGFGGAALLGAVIGSLAALRIHPTLVQDSWVWYQVHWFQAAAIAVALMIPALMTWKVKDNGWTHATTHVSLVSYSIYLIHLPIKAILVAAGVMAALPIGLSWSLWVLLTIVCSTITYRLIEEPFLALRDRPGMPWTPWTVPQAGMALPAEQPLEAAGVGSSRPVVMAATCACSPSPPSRF